jgi:S1 RNA binding domain protein
MQVEAGMVIEGKVTGITNFGAFVQLPDGKTGLIHISEVSDEYVKDIKSHLKENQVVKVKILSADNGKISLSIKRAKESNESGNTAPAQQPRQLRSYDTGRPSKYNTENMSFEDRISKFMKDSEEKMHDIKKNFEAKRGSGSYRKSSF